LAEHRQRPGSIIDYTMAENKLLKKDLFGEIRLVTADGQTHIMRDSSAASVWIHWLARRMLQQEARILAVMINVEAVPKLIAIEPDLLTRSYLAGSPIHMARPTSSSYFKNAAKLLRQLHRANVVHNDLAKEPNLLVCEDGSAGIIDFQLAWFAPRRGLLFRLLAYDDLRHLLKHKRYYCPNDLTVRELAILSKPSLPSRIWMHTVKPIYMFVTRQILRWSDREGASAHGDQL
jgi:predicted Ser/Thr protein kinase